MILNSHLKELYLRFIYIIFSYLLIVIVFFMFSDLILYKLMAMYNLPTNIVFTYPGEALIGFIFISVMGGLIVIWPLISIQTFWFLKPGLFRFEVKSLKSFLIIINVYSWTVIILINGLISPIIYSYLLSLQNEYLDYLPKFSEFLNFNVKVLYLCIFLVILPLVIFWLNIEKSIIQNRHYLILISLLIGGLFTPPDVLSQILMGLLIVSIIEITVFVKFVYNEYFLSHLSD